MNCPDTNEEIISVTHSNEWSDFQNQLYNQSIARNPFPEGRQKGQAGLYD